MEEKKKKLAVFKFASCDGCQLSVLDLEDDLLLLSDKLEISYFLEATSRIEPGPYDISLVEGSITTEEDKKRIKQVRKDSKIMITIGACATVGGIQALRNFKDVSQFIRQVYAHPEYIDTLEKSHAIKEFVHVDFELTGCPINKYQLRELIASFLWQKKPNIRQESVCVECKRQGQVCLVVTKGEACLGPVTQAGCGALCPKYARGCFGCYGPKENAHPAPLSDKLKELGHDSLAMHRLYRNFVAAAESFVKEAQRHE